nr:hypothetical protein [Tanacetum cinerariifolium]
ALRALANAAVANDSDAATDVPAATSPTPPGTSGVATGTTEVATGTTGAATGTSGVATGTTGVAAGASEVVASASGVGAGPYRVALGDSTGSPGGLFTPTANSAVSADSPQVPPGASNKGKSPIIEEDIPVPARTFRQMEEDRLGEEVPRRLHKEELAEMEREREEAHRKRQQEKKRQALAEQSFKERQNRPLTPAQQKAYMRQYVKNQSSAIYNTGWSIAYVKSFLDEQLLHEFKKIRKVHTQSQLHSFSKTFKRTGFVLEERPTKKRKSHEEPISSMPEIPIPPVGTSPPSSRTWRKSIAHKPLIKPKSTLSMLDLDAPAQTFLKVIVDDDSDDKEYVYEVWSAVVGWELISTPLGEVNALYRINGTTKHFTTLRQILHLVDCQDLM